MKREKGWWMEEREGGRRGNNGEYDRTMTETHNKICKYVHIWKEKRETGSAKVEDNATHAGHLLSEEIIWINMWEGKKSILLSVI